MTLYSNGCPKCKVLKAKLDEKGLSYDTCDDVEVMRNKGFRSVPMLEVNDAVMDFNKAILYIKEI